MYCTQGCRTREMTVRVSGAMRGRTNFRMEEGFRPEETFVSHVDGEWFLRHGIDPCVLQIVLARIFVILGELFRDIRTDVAVTFLEVVDAYVQVGCGRDAGTLIALAVSSDCSGGMVGSLSRRSD